MVFWVVPKNAMQAYIEYKACYDKKANASKLKNETTFMPYSPK